MLLSKEDTDVWMQILVYLVFGVLWVIGVISKKMQKNQQEKQTQPQQRNKPQAKLPVHSEKINQQADNVIPNPSKLEQIKRLQSKINKLETPMSADIKKIPTKMEYEKHTKARSSYKQEIIADLTTDPDTLKKAILYHEILGKPVSLRDYRY